MLPLFLPPCADCETSDSKKKGSTRVFVQQRHDWLYGGKSGTKTEYRTRVTTTTEVTTSICRRFLAPPSGCPLQACLPACPQVRVNRAATKTPGSLFASSPLHGRGVGVGKSGKRRQTADYSLLYHTLLVFVGAPSSRRRTAAHHGLDLPLRFRHELGVLHQLLHVSAGLRTPK